MRELRYREALREAMTEEMVRDERVFIMGEEVGHYQGAYKVTEGMLAQFGEKRVMDTPIAEEGFAGIAIGAAMVGLRPIVEFMTWNFSAVAFDQILSNATKLRQMSGGQFTVPIVFRGPNGAARQTAAQHSHAMETFYAQIPGLKVVVPSTAADAKGLMASAIRDDNPVLVLEDERLYGIKGEVPEGEHLVPIGVAAVRRAGTQCTIATWGKMVPVSLEAAELLAAEGVQCEVIDLRSLRPLDHGTVATSVRKTGRLVIVHEAWPYGGPGAELSDRVQRDCFDSLRAPIVRCTGRDASMPYNKKLEELTIPGSATVTQAVRAVMAY
ncbi:MAG: pyruvate dehydrogenase complex E1 component subunit beta [Deltaproteobacteria bacterium]|nr:pyruvate dehydrogenase complex E1 component subunit beta [Deltaproteobacteria bacterium]